MNECVLHLTMGCVEHEPFLASQAACLIKGLGPNPALRLGRWFFESDRDELHFSITVKYLVFPFIAQISNTNSVQRVENRVVRG